jgi:hypothetical protein
LRRTGFLKKREKEIAAVGLRRREVTSTAVHGGEDDVAVSIEREREREREENVMSEKTWI